MPIYIKGLGAISAQRTFDGGFLSEIKSHTGEYLSCIEPDYKTYLNPTLIRRMGRILKMGVASASICLKDADVENPDAIITGTGFGCLVDTDKFLSSIIENEEQFLTPTNFIQSTHNTISAQIALSLKCLNYNFTYVHRGFSFESSVQDAVMLLNEGEGKNILVGAVDEITPSYFNITKRLGLWKPSVDGHLNLAQQKSKGALAGEGASYFVLSKEESPANYAVLRDFSTFYKPQNIDEIEKEIRTVLSKNKPAIEDIDVVVLGLNGDHKGDEVYKNLAEGLFENNNLAYFKHLSGEYATAIGFGVWLGAKILKSQVVPEVVNIRNNGKKEIKNILIYNHYLEVNHSVYLLSKP